MDAKSSHQPQTYALELPGRAGPDTEAVPLPPRPAPVPKRGACMSVWRPGPVRTGPSPGAGAAFWKRRFLLLSLALVLAFLACYLAVLATGGLEYGTPVAPEYVSPCSDDTPGGEVCEPPPRMGGLPSLEQVKMGGEEGREVDGEVVEGGPTTTVPQYFQTSPELWAGPTATGKAPFMAQTRTFEGTYVPNAPLQTAVPVVGGGDEENKSIFERMGYLAPYIPSPGFGVDEYPLPNGAEIIQVQMLSRHGSRYPTTGSNVANFGDRIEEARKTGKLRFKEGLEFLNKWEYGLGIETLVPKGRQELFDSGVLHAYMYSRLYNPHSKIIARTTTQDRMLKSAEYFMAGFFGLEWTRNATIEVIIEGSGFNNSLAGDNNCPNAHKVRSGLEDATVWIEQYLQNATDRLAAMVEGLDWTVQDTYAAQTMCPYETVAYGYSRFCELFTYDEWAGFEYSVDLGYYGGSSFGSPTGRAVGIGYQQEVVARLKNHTLGYSGSQINVTLDNNTTTFPLNQSLYLDFTHDTNIISVLTAFGLTQFSGKLDPNEHPGAHNFTVSHLTPFGARLDIEIIRTPRPLAADRQAYLEGGETSYVHFVLNQRSIPLGWSHAECDASRVDGWCELGAFLKVQEAMETLARYDEACFGKFPLNPYQRVEDGAPAWGG